MTFLFKRFYAALGLFLCISLGWCSVAVAQSPGCTAATANSPISFGSVSSLAISTTPKGGIQTNAGIRCGGSLISVLGTDAFINANVSTVNGAQLKNAAGDSIPYQFYADPGYTQQITPGTDFNYNTNSTLTLLGLGSQTTYTPFPMYFRTNLASYNLSAGTYTDTVTIQWNWRVCQGLSVLGICVTLLNPPNTGTTNSTFILTLVVTEDCLITAPNINFGTAPLVTSFNPVTQTITMTCTKGSNYTVSLSDGQNASGVQRRLAFGGNYINYEIYQGSSGTTRWGSTAGQTRSSSSVDTGSSGPASGVNAQGFTYRAVILSGQNTPPAGTYTDTILVNVSF